MTSSSGSDGDLQLTSVRGYPRAAVEEFLAGAAAERSRLQRRIDDAHARAARARATLETPHEEHRALVSMVIDARRELDERRRSLEPGALAILARGEREARAILASARADVESLPDPAERDRVVDLTAVTRRESAEDSGSPRPSLHSGGLRG